MAPSKMLFQRRHRTESVRSSNSITSTDELMSCFDDDVCTTCGNAVHAGQLYCSQECREEDALTGVNASMASTSAPAQSQQRRHSVKPPTRVSSGEVLAGAMATADRHRQMYGGKTQDSNTDGKFRYVCPPSPSILAKPNGGVPTTKATATSHLTSPALAALDQQTPSMQLQTKANGVKAPRSSSERDWMSSSSEESNTQAHNSSSQRRSSSRSTSSSASDATLSTDQSTPSPAGRATVEEDWDDLDALADFTLPPSVYPAPTVMLNASAASHRSPAQKTVPLPGTGQAGPRRETMATMSYARRPSRTNLPAPVIFNSPILKTTQASTKNKSPRDSYGEHGRNGSNGTNHFEGPTLAELRKIVAGETSSISPELQRSSVSAMPVMHGSERTRTSPPSPPQVASASSSAGKTMRAFSPATMTTGTSPAMVEATLINIPSSTHHSPTPEVGFVCGRYGCQGLSGGSAESVKATAEPMQTTVSNAVKKTRRLSSLLAHKHTHSAAAGLSLMAGKEQRGDGQATTKKLAMTPLVKAEALPSDGASVESDASELLSRLVKSPPRGRSHARGRSSTSRRSPSPPRGVARRGRSEDMLSSKGGPYVSPRSQPIAVSRVSPHSDVDVHDADDEEDEEKEQRETGRRGRSPTERGRVMVRAPQPMKTVVAPAVKSSTPPIVDIAAKVSSNGYDEVDLDEL